MIHSVQKYFSPRPLEVCFWSTTRWSGAFPALSGSHGEGPVGERVLFFFQHIKLRRKMGDLEIYPYDLDETPAPTSTRNSKIPPI